MAEMSLKQLEAFVSVADTGSFTRAAEELFLSQSTVSGLIGALETALGTRLLLRGERRKVRLTEEGERAYNKAKRILADCRELEESFAGAKEGSLLLGASTVPGQYLLPSYLSLYLKKYPETRYILRHGDTAQVHRLLQEGEIRIGFVGAMLDPKIFKYLPLAEDRLVLAAQNNERYRKMKNANVHGADLLTEPLVTRKDGSGTYLTFRNYIDQIIIPKNQLNIVAQVDDPEAIKNMVSQGLGVSVLSALSIAQEVAAGTLLSFEMSEDSLKRDLYLIYRRDTELTVAERRFASFLLNCPKPMAQSDQDRLQTQPSN